MLGAWGRSQFNFLTHARPWIYPCQLWSKHASSNTNPEEVVESCSSRYLVAAWICNTLPHHQKCCDPSQRQGLSYMKFAHDLGQVSQVWHTHTHEDQRRTGIVGICEALFSVRRSCEICRFLGRHAKEPRIGGSVSVATLPAVRKANAAFQKCSTQMESAAVCSSAVGKPQIWQPLTPLLTSWRR